MQCATLLCTNAFSYNHQSIRHAIPNDLPFTHNPKYYKPQLGLKPHVKSLRKTHITTGAGGKGVDSILEKDDKLRKLTQALLWTWEGVYVLWLFLLPYAPGDPVWAISSETINDLMSEGQFNFVIGWTCMFSPLLYSDRKRDSYKGSLDLLWGLQMFLTNTFLMPYMAIRLHKVDSEYPPKTTSQLGSIMTRGAAIVGLVGGAVCLLSAIWAIIGRADGDFGSISDRC